MKKRICRNWNLFRIIRLIVGISVIIASAMMHMLIIGIFGSMIVVQAIVNTTCCDTVT